MFFSCGEMEEILPQVDTYVFVEHSNKPVITITGQKVVTGSVRSYNTTGVKVFKDMSIHVDLFPTGNMINEDVEEDDESDQEEVSNETTEKKQDGIGYKVNKVSLLGKFIQSFQMVENILGKGECTGYQDIIFFPPFSQNFSGFVKTDFLT